LWVGEREEREERERRERREKGFEREAKHLTRKAAGSCGVTVTAIERLVARRRFFSGSRLLAMEDGVPMLVCDLCPGQLSSDENGRACARCDAEAADGRRYCKGHKGYTSNDKFLGEKKTCEVSNCPGMEPAADSCVFLRTASRRRNGSTIRRRR